MEVHLYFILIGFSPNFIVINVYCLGDILKKIPQPNFGIFLFWKKMTKSKGTLHEANVNVQILPE